jgi:outer membrane protein with beta-barrel domain
MRRLISFSVAVPFFFGLHAVRAQSPSSQPSRWSLELSGDAAFPTRTVAGAELQTGGGVGFNVRYRFQPHLAAYAGWEWHLQQTDELSVGQTLDLNDNGYTLGLRFEHPLLASTAGWVRAGALINHIEVEDENGKNIDDTGHGLGWEGAVGLTFPLGQRFGLIPSLRYRSLSRDLTVDGVTSPATLSYVTAGLGFSIAF